MRFWEPWSNRYSVRATWGPVTSFPLYKPDLFGASYPRNYSGRWTHESRTDSAARPKTREGLLSSRARNGRRVIARQSPSLRCVGRAAGIISETSSERVEAPRCWVPRAVCAIIQRGLILPACSGSRRNDSRGSTSSFCFFRVRSSTRVKLFPLSNSLDLRNIIMKSRFFQLSSLQGLQLFEK